MILYKSRIPCLWWEKIMLAWFLRKTLVWLLGFVDRYQPYGPALFNALARLMPMVAIEAVCFRRAAGGDEVYLLQRSGAESAYPGQWHCPGSILRMGETVEDVFRRLEEKEFGSGLRSWHFLFNINNRKEARGHGFSVVHLCMMKEEDAGRGRWFRVDKLPAEIVDWHRDQLIPQALQCWQGN
ncbi:NUDIX domain-containing protein [Candidatus Parcubacteria bacterium]|nr:NUDIX domain-containing protein [Candidatus Parcubacteria bacterium]